MRSPLTQKSRSSFSFVVVKTTKKKKEIAKHKKMFVELFLTTLVALIAYAMFKLRKLSTSSAQYYEERHLKHVGVLTALKNLFGLFLARNDFLEVSQRMYNLYPDEP